jgi:hypothetical protein
MHTKNKIIQFSPPRTGSTLVYNLLRELFPLRSVRKTHKCFVCDPGDKVVVTHRHPLDAIASSILRYNAKPSLREFQSQIENHFLESLSGIVELKGRENVLFLRYEKLYENYDYIFDEMAAFFRVEIPLEVRRGLSDRYSIPSVEKISSQFSQFSQFDAETHFHGKHISAYRGRPYYFREYFSPEQIEYLDGRLGHFLREFDYVL